MDSTAVSSCPAKTGSCRETYIEQPGALSIWINDRLIASGALWPMHGGVSASLGWLREHLARKNQALLPGQIVLAGTPLGLYPVQAGEQIVVRVDDKVEVECQVL